MRLWRLSGVQHALSFDGGYGLLFEGRWNRIGRPVTYCATSPSLCVLEKLVHIEDPTLLPDLVMLCYDAPDAFVLDERRLSDLPGDWREHETMTQAIGDAWLEGGTAPLLRVPSAIVLLRDSPDLNLLINHRHPDVGQITLVSAEPFALDVRLLTL
jgi:RES domain-containing protein